MVIIGVGNLLMKDDGFGIHVVEALEVLADFEDVEVVDAMTRTATVMEAMDGHETAIVVDAISMPDGEPGDLHTFRFDPHRGELPADVTLSVHDMHFMDSIKTGADVYDFPDEIVVIGVEPDTIAVGSELSPTCERAIPMVIEELRSEIDGK